ncbi:queuosine precursor transporter [Candidatus Dependentiae bacterium]
MNEIIFFLHVILVVTFSLGALFFGKSALISMICLQSILANLFVVKQMTLFGMAVTCSDVFIIGSVLCLNLLQEYFGQEIVKKTIRINFFVIFFYLIMSQLHIFYTPNSFDFTHNSFLSILNFMPRITIASIFTYFLVQMSDCWLYGLLKLHFAGRYLVGRNIFSICCTQLLDTLLFSFLGLYGIVGSILNVILVSFTIKIIIIFLTTPFVSFAKKVVRNI